MRPVEKEEACSAVTTAQVPSISFAGNLSHEPCSLVAPPPHSDQQVGSMLPYCGSYAAILWVLCCHIVGPMLPYCGPYAAILWALCCHIVGPMLPYCGPYAAILWALCCHIVGPMLPYCGHIVGGYEPCTRYDLSIPIHICT